MNLLILMLISFFPRPVCPPITENDYQLFLTLKQYYQNAFTPLPALPVNPRPLSNQLVIGYEPDKLPLIINRLQNLKVEIIFVDSAARFLVVNNSFDQSEPLNNSLNQLPGIRFIEPDYPVKALVIPNDPMFITKQWDKWVMYADLAWDIVTGGPVKIAVVDNGIEYYHPDLAANFRPGELGYDFINNDSDPKPDNPAIENAFHGTHVSGIIAAVSNNLIGIAGWAQIQLLAVRVLNDSGSGNLSDVARGIRWAADQGARVINLSLGGDAASSVLIEACQYALGKGTLLVAASGNDGRSGITYPARLSECIAVGATDDNSELAPFSNYGPEQELTAPGTGIYSTATGGSYREASGTSMSCPQVSGVAGLLFATNPALTPAEARSILAASALDMGDPGRDTHYGYGLVNAYRALQLAHQLLRTTINPAAINPQSMKTLITRRPLIFPPTREPVWVFNSAGMLLLKLPPNSTKINLPGAGTYLLQIRSAHALQPLLKIIVTD
uniref:Peptidase S8 n=1 Tax=candidate division WOR-3 bacterium TaxID=2052148 RepID=A0A7V3PU22_UNCW3